MRANNQKVFTPREGKLISDINKVMSSELPRSLQARAGTDLCALVHLL